MDSATNNFSRKDNPLIQSFLVQDLPNVVLLQFSNVQSTLLELSQVVGEDMRIEFQLGYEDSV